jgi:hypothetical protein
VLDYLELTDYMAILHNFECSDGHITEKMVDSNEGRKRCAYEGCRRFALRVFLPKHRNAQPFEPTYYHIDGEGNVRCIMDKNAPMPPGYELRRVETLADYRKLAKYMNAKDRSKMERSIENEERYFEEERKARRSDFMQDVQRMSPLGRDYAMWAIEQNNRKGRRSSDPGFHIEAYE